MAGRVPRVRGAAAILLALGTVAALLGALAWASVITLIEPRAISSPTGAYALRGVLPWSDAFDYWSAAQRLMQTGALDEWGSRRPLNGAFLAARLGVSGDHLGGALLFQSILLALACASLVLVVARRFGVVSGLASALLLVAVGAIVQPTLQSEGLGLLLGAAGLAMLLVAGAPMTRPALDEGKACPPTVPWQPPSTRLMCGGLGLAMLSIAMAARPGALFLLPALGIWLFWRHRAKWGRALIVVMLALAAGTATDRMARVLYASPGAAGNANFAMTVLGLARGTDYYEADRWLRSAHPDVQSESALASHAFEQAASAVRRSPETMISTLARNEWRFVARFWPLLLLSIIGIWRASRRSERGDRHSESEQSRASCAACGERSFWIMGWLGILASVPIVFGDGGIRVLAATWPFIIVSACTALRTRTRRSITAPGTPNASAGCDHIDPLARFAGALAAVTALLTVATALAGPALARRLGWFDGIPAAGAVMPENLPRPGTQEVDWVRAPPALHAIIVTDQGETEAMRSTSTLPASFGIVAIEDLMREPAVIEFGEPLDRIERPFLLCVVYDINQSRARVFTLPATSNTAAALGASIARSPTKYEAVRVLRIDSNPLRPGGRVRVGVQVAPEPFQPHHR